MYKRKTTGIIFILLMISTFYPLPVLSYTSPELSRLLNEGITYHNNRNYLLAIKSFKNALDIDPNNEKILKNISIVHNNYGKYLAERTDGLGAAREFRNALFYNTDNHVARNNLETKLAAMNYSVTDPVQRVEQAKMEAKNSNFFAAVAELKEANRIEETVDAYLEMGSVYHVLYLKSGRTGNYADEAIEALEKAMSLNQLDIRPLIKLGDVYIAKNEISKGIDLYEEAIKQDPASKEAQGALVSGWLAAIRIAPHIPSNHVGLGTAYQLRGDYVQAERAFRRALQLDPNNRYAKDGLSSLQVDRVKTQVSLFLNRAIDFQKSGRYDESLTHYIKALNLEPNNPDIHFNIGTAFQAKGDLLRAKKAYTKTLELNPAHGEAKTALDNLIAKQQEQHVAEAFQHAIDLQTQGKTQEAIDIYKKISADRPDDDSLFFNLGTAYQAINDYDNAIINYDKAYKLKQELSYAEALQSAKVQKANDLLDEGIKEQTAGNNEDAIEYYLDVVDLFPDNASAWYNLGTAYQATGDNDMALDAYTKAYDIDVKGQSEAIFFAALILEEKKQLLDAIQLYEKYVSVAPAGTYSQEAKDREEYIKSFL